MKGLFMQIKIPSDS